MNQQNQKLYVGNVNFDASEDQVRELFGTFGEVQEVKIVMDRFSGRSRGFAFVRMATADDAGKAKDSLNGQPFQGKALVIDWARTEQRDRPMGERRERPAGEFRPRREGAGGWGGERRDREPRGDRGGYNRY
ncbi:MAG: RNA-binding protein [Chlamydiae bacterium CG10_big_fil_rev_8_21_14_0_10_42_34]|nr:MAG: RNA-binding protein [Chlamydiae bacterium CG10_big_fil_rev_8_21_14_0_10_42_34]